ncbi:MAG: UDP-4-amino-4,6-dideoxy-N-acetyl-beta-L-altrosamine transaminase [Patescibacteria group bacterium]|nr:UDP-4-amino-4,6-dideoxy-N-acetyl-beta-L-altrosamine transaminase [Patescibacteria group bacterium]
MKKPSIIPYGHQTIRNDDIAEVVKVLKSNYLTQGPKVKEFEQNLADYCGRKYAVVFSSGTAALEAAYYAAGIGAGDEIITTPLTFAATSNMILARGAKPVFVDIDSSTGNLDPKEFEKKINKKTKSLVVVDYAGMPADLNLFKEICNKNNLVFIEDSSHALGASFEGKKVGAIADMTIFSFHPVKSITTGEGGAVITGKKDYYERLVLFRSHGIIKDKKKFFSKSPAEWYHEMQDIGFNFRLSDICAALGVSQMRKLDKFIAKRKLIAKRYKKELSGLKNFILPKDISGRESSWHLFVLRIIPLKKHLRNFVFTKLQNKGIGVQVHYLPVYLHPYYQMLGYKKNLCPKAEFFAESEISIPIFPTLSFRNQSLIIKTLKEIDKML